MGMSTLQTKKTALRYGFPGIIALTALFIVACSNEQTDENTQSADNQIHGHSTLSAEEHCKAVIASVDNAGFSDQAKVICDQEHAYIHSDSYASHEMMTGIVGTNEQIPVPAPGYFAPVRLNPTLTNIPKSRDSSLAIAVNGIPIFDYSAGGELTTDELYYHQPHMDAVALKQLDVCGGHTGRGDDYHYHELPRCMIEEMNNKDDNPIIGWGFDGYPLYGNNNPDGSTIEPGFLDVCNGQPDSIFGYRYHTSDEHPYILQCLMGEVGELKYVANIATTRPYGIPIEVENLAFTNQESGEGLLTYNYEGESYYIKASPTKPNCYDFEWRTFTNGGVVESGEHCNIIRTDGGMGPL